MKLPVVTTGLSTSVYLAICLESFLYGFYSGIFVMYLQSQAFKKGTDNAKRTIFYALCALYPLSTAILILNTASALIDPDVIGSNVVYHVDIVASTLFCCCDFIAQSVLIYRCWIVWNKNIRVTIIPSILAIAFLATWIASITAVLTEQGKITTTRWGNSLTITGLVMSMTVNALVTGLIVFKIFIVFREVRATSDKVLLSVIGGTKTRSVIFVIIESGMILFSVQLARVVVTIVMTVGAVDVMGAVHQMVNGITPTIILVRVSMGLSFHDETSMLEAAGSFLRFPPDDPNPNLDTETEGVDQHGSVLFAPDDLSLIPKWDVSARRRDHYVGGSDGIGKVNG